MNKYSSNLEINSDARRIDTHHHFVPAFYREWLWNKGITSAGGRLIPEWSPEHALAFMDATGVETAILSLSTPGVEPGIGPGPFYDGLSEGRTMARRVNEYGAELVSNYPERFGFFATLTLPDIDGALDELAYALDVLGADGVVLLANVRGIYLGDPAFDELMAELDRRSSVVFVHPSQLPVPPVPGVAPYVADFLLDTTRAAIKLVQSGTMDRHQRLKMILSHAGGFVPYAAGRIAGHIVDPDDLNAGRDPLRYFYFDTALSSTRFALPSLMAFAAPGRVIYGSDYPYAAPQRSAWFTAELDKYDSISHSQVNRENALALFPRIAAFHADTYTGVK